MRTAVTMGKKMADPSARWHGDNYQSRHFWLHASSLLDDHHQHVIEVTFEAHGPKAFDDIVVRYNPGRPSKTSQERIAADYYQIKWHTDYVGHFGFADLIDPQFIGATSISLLERLRDAKKQCCPGSQFHFVTTYALSEGDPLTRLIFGVDGSLRLNVLFDGTTDRSVMGRVRKSWREHLGLCNDDELRNILTGFHIEHGARNLEALRADVALRFRIVGLDARETETAFIYDEFARVLVTKKVNRLDRATFRKLCEQEGWFLATRPAPKRGISIQVYNPRARPADILLAAPDQTLSLAHFFNGRHLRAEGSWDTIRDEVVSFLAKRLSEGPDIRLFLEAPSSLAFLSGACLGFKAGACVELIQVGLGNSNQVWDTNDDRSGPEPVFEQIDLNGGKDIALVISMTRNAMPKAEEYVRRELPKVGRIVHVTPQDGPSQKSISGGQHALAIAHKVGEVISNMALPGARTHVFLAAPNALSFYLGQQADPMGICIPYEFDFKKQVDGSYQATFEINFDSP